MAFVAEAGKEVLRATRERNNPVDAWLEQATGVARGKTTPAKVMQLTRGED